LETDVSCAVFAVMGVEWDGRTEFGLVGVWLVSKPGLDLPLIVVLLLRSLAGDTEGIGLGSLQVMDSRGKKYFEIVSRPSGDPAGIGDECDLN
jgi:hypothetical protein